MNTFAFTQSFLSGQKSVQEWIRARPVSFSVSEFSRNGPVSVASKPQEPQASKLAKPAESQTKPPASVQQEGRPDQSQETQPQLKKIFKISAPMPAERPRAAMLIPAVIPGELGSSLLSTAKLTVPPVGKPDAKVQPPPPSSSQPPPAAPLRGTPPTARQRPSASTLDRWRRDRRFRRRCFMEQRQAHQSRHHLPQGRQGLGDR